MCDIRYFRAALHKLTYAKETLKHATSDEMFINDAAYTLQQCVEFTLKAFLECKGLSVPPTHQIEKLVAMTKNNKSACEVTAWIEDNKYDLTEWESQTRYNFDYYVELSRIEKAIEEIEAFLKLNGLTNERLSEITEEDITILETLMPKNKLPKDDFELNVYYKIFKHKISEKKNVKASNADNKSSRVPEIEQSTSFD